MRVCVCVCARFCFFVFMFFRFGVMGFGGFGLEGNWGFGPHFPFLCGGFLCEKLTGRSEAWGRGPRRVREFCLGSLGFKASRFDLWRESYFFQGRGLPV